MKHYKWTMLLGLHLEGRLCILTILISEVIMSMEHVPISPVILWEKRGLPETNCNKRYFYRILIRIFL